jgi:hypothetical protein
MADLLAELSVSAGVSGLLDQARARVERELIETFFDEGGCPRG